MTLRPFHFLVAPALIVGVVLFCGENLEHPEKNVTKNLKSEEISPLTLHTYSAATPKFCDEISVSPFGGGLSEAPCTPTILFSLKNQPEDDLKLEIENLMAFELRSLQAQKDALEVMKKFVTKISEPINERNIGTIGSELLNAYQSCMANHFVFAFPEICGSIDSVMQKSFLTLFEMHKIGNRTSTAILSEVLQTKNQSPQHRSNYESLGISAGFPSNEDMLTSITQNQQNPIPL